MCGDAKEVFVERGEVVGFFHRDERRLVGLNAVVVEFLLGGEQSDGVDLGRYGRWSHWWSHATCFDSPVAGNHLARRRNHIDLKTLFVVTEQADFREAVEGKSLQFLESRVLVIDSEETHVNGSLSHYSDST